MCLFVCLSGGVGGGLLLFFFFFLFYLSRRPKGHLKKGCSKTPTIIIIIITALTIKLFTGNSALTFTEVKPIEKTGMQAIILAVLEIEKKQTNKKTRCLVRMRVSV